MGMATSILSLQDFLSRDSNGLSHSTFSCPYCGKTHQVPIGEMRVGHLVEEIPHALERILQHPPRKAQILFDRAIEEVILEQVTRPLRQNGLNLSLLPAGEKGVLLDSETELGNRLALAVDDEAEILIGAGSGVICDLTKWVATRTQRPFLIFGTAPSMNAYTSITATMTENDVKTSVLLNPADAVFLDVDIMVNAPMSMIHAGVGDLAARSICNADWKLSHFIRGGYFCPLPYEMTAENEWQVHASARGIAHRETQAISFLGEAILKSGLSMTILNGETSPSSGAEHVISHFWDLLTHTRHLPKNLHGTQVGVGTIIMLAFYEYMRKIDPGKIDPRQVIRRRPPVEDLLRENQARYGKAAPIFNEVVKTKYLTDDALADRIRWVQNHWEQLWNAVTPYAPSLESIREPLHQAGMPMSLSAVHRSKEDAMEALIKGPQYRSRYTLLDLAWELGLFPEAAEAVLDLAGVLE
jgi:glycerol-1-phosphate dehydrogenase [NAD(P)+]